jgi:hypothetical protein
MKNNARWIARIVGIYLASLPLQAAPLQAPPAAQLGIALIPANRTYILGQPVSLRVSLRNSSTREISLVAQLAPRYGNLIIEVSEDGKLFKKYLGPGWGTADTYSPPKRLAPSQEISEIVTLLWNRPIPGTSDQVSTDFVFPHSGMYWLRARLIDKEPIGQSNVIQISVNSPVGEDAPVWDAIRSAPQLAYFIQSPRGDSSSEKAKLEAILQQHATSTYAPYIREAIQKVSGR